MVRSRVTARWWAAAAAVLLAVAGAWALSRPPTSTVPTLAEATTALEQSLAAAQDHSADPCAVAASRGQCTARLQDAPPPPSTVPDVLCDLVVPAEGSSAGGRVLRVAGRDGAGTPFVSDVMVVVSDGRPALMNAAFWVPSEVSAPGATTSADRLEPPCAA